MSLNKGRKPLSERQAPKLPTFDDMFGSAFDIPKEVKSELESKGLEGRWVSLKSLGANHGYHPRGWRAYKAESLKASNLDFLAGQSPDGYLHRGTLILAVRSKEVCDQHRAVNKARIKQAKDLEKDQADRLRHKAAAIGLDTMVVEGHDD